MASSQTPDTKNYLLSIPDLSTAIINNNTPSILLSSPQDKRIDTFARSQEKYFLVKGEASESFVVIVNPKKEHGLLWWKKYDRLVLSQDRWMELQKNLSLMNDEEKVFFSNLP